MKQWILMSYESNVSLRSGLWVTLVPSPELVDCDPPLGLDCREIEDISKKVELPPSNLQATLDPSLDGVGWEAGALKGKENSPDLDPEFSVVFDKLSDNFSTLLTLLKVAVW